MKVVLLLPTFPKLSESFIVTKVLCLLDSGWDIHVVCGRSNQEEWLRFPELQRHSDLKERVHVTMPHRPRWLVAMLFPLAFLRCAVSRPQSTWRYLRLGFRRFGLNALRRFYLDAELIRLQPDLIHFEFGSLAAKRMYLKELLDCRVIVSFRGYDLNYVGLATPDYYKAVWKKADAIHLLGRDLLNRARRRGCPEDKPFALIPPAVDLSFFTPAKERTCAAVGTRERPFRILSVGRLEWKKGYEYALQAARLLTDKGVHYEYHIVGDGAFSEPIAFAMHQLGLNDQIQRLGARQRSDVREEMLWADVFLHAAVSEGFCNAVLEAQAMALPIVCTDADGLSENVVSEVTGFVVPRRDPQLLAEKLLLLMRQPGLRQRMGEDGQKRVLEFFQIEKQAADFDQLYRDVLPKGMWPPKSASGPIRAQSHGAVLANAEESEKGSCV